MMYRHYSYREARRDSDRALAPHKAARRARILRSLITLRHILAAAGVLPLGIAGLWT